MENNKSNYDEMKDLMKKITIEMRRSRERKNIINNKKDEIFEKPISNATKKVEEEIQEIEEQKNDFDERTKNALLVAREQISKIQEEQDSKYQQEIMEPLKKQVDIKRRYESMKKDMVGKDMPEERLLKLKEITDNKLLEINDNIKDIQENYNTFKAELDKYNNSVTRYIEELEGGIEAELLEFETEDIDLVLENQEELTQESTEPEQENEEKLEQELTEPEQENKEELEQEPVEPEQENEEDLEKEPTEPEQENEEDLKQEPIEPKQENEEELEQELIELVEENKGQHKQEKPKQTNNTKTNNSYEEIESNSEKSEFSLESIEINAKDNKMYLYIKDENGNTGRGRKHLDYSEEYYQSDKIQNIYNKITSMMGDEKTYNVYDKLDPNILYVLSTDDDLLLQYVRSVYDYTKMPFELKYNLKGIKEGELPKESRKTLKKVARRVKGIENVNVEKDDNIFIRAYNKVKSAIQASKQKMIDASNKRKIKNQPNKEKSGRFTHAKQKVKTIGKGMKDAYRAFRDSIKEDGHQEEAIENYNEKVEERKVQQHQLEK